MSSCRFTSLPLALTLVIVCAACAKDAAGPEPFKPQYYKLTAVDDRTIPLVIFGDSLVGATLVPYAVGRPLDQRLVNDRTGRGETGGNTRDTTVLRGQMMDIRQFKRPLNDSVTVYPRDSTIVDVEIRDTVFIITRPHPDPARTQVDTGAVLGRLLIVPTTINDRWNSGQQTRPAVLHYEITR